MAALSCAAVLLGSTAGCGSKFFAVVCGGPTTAASLLAALNTVPVVTSVAATHWSLLSDNCPVRPGEACDYLGILLDVIGLISARLARLDLGISLLLAARGESSWLLGATGGWLGFAEAVPLHRSAGWWCVRQSALHSVAYLLFYLETGGLASLWRDCLPTPLPNATDTTLNRLGLVNFLGVVALVVVLALALPALHVYRSRSYHIFQALHLPVGALFVVCCALHDLPILLFAVPGIASWCLEWNERHHGGRHLSCASQCLSARARLLPGTSGPWIELCVERGAVREGHGVGGAVAPRGQWVSLKVLPLGAECHPLSVAASASRNAGELSVLVSGGAGDWTRRLAALAQSADAHRFDVEIAGPYPFGGGDWSLNGDTAGDQPALLLLAGGTGVAGWLTGLAAADSANRWCRLVWCVQTEADYHALAGRLPFKGRVQVMVYVTRAAAHDAPLTSRTLPEGQDESERAEHQPYGSRSAAPVSLAAALAGLAVGHWGWIDLVERLGLAKFPHATVTGWLHTTLTGYFLSRRCLPIVLIVLSMMAAMALCRRALVYARAYLHGRCRWRAGPRDTELGSASPPQPDVRLFTGASSTAHAEPTDVSVQDGARPSTGVGGHTVRAGRPDLAALVREAAVEAGSRRLVVAACGPETLVSAARKAVAAARRDHRSVRLEFSGADSRW